MTLNTDSILSPAETKVASGYVAGMIGKEIAEAAGISPNTVVRHTQNIYNKTGIPRSTNALVSWFLAKNYNLDLQEFRRRVGAVALLTIISIQTICTDFNSDFIRQSRQRVENQKCGRRGRRRGQDEDTLYLTSI